MSAFRRDFAQESPISGAFEATPVDARSTLVGKSAAMRAAIASLCSAAETDSTVLLYGEPGTGKTRAAETLHALSARREGPFVVVDCARETERLGCEVFEAAHAGSVFFGRIGELGRELQARLLRGIERSPADVRVIAAAHRPLAGEVEAGRFRADLYYRIAVVEVTLPPLRDRAEDIPALIEHFLEQLGASERSEAERLRQAGPSLQRYLWPGNVRELERYVERSLASCRLEPLDSSTPLGLRAARQQWINEFEARYLRELLERYHGNVSACARAASVDRKYFHRLLVKHGLR
jgi:DNA-binding NtrC family response regulator